MVATLVVVVAARDCIEIARNSKPGIIGGYRVIKNPEKDVVVKKIVADSIALRNKDTPIGFSYADDDHYEAYHTV